MLLQTAKPMFRKAFSGRCAEVARYLRLVEAAVLAGVSSEHLKEAMNSATRLAALFGAFMLTAPAAHALLAHNVNLQHGFINGNGNANGGFTVDTSNGVELGLRGKLRHDPTASGQPKNQFNFLDSVGGIGRYKFDAGAWMGAGGSASTAFWSVEYAINTNVTGTTGLALNDLRYEFRIDGDPSAATAFMIIDVINAANPGSPGFGQVWWDHAMGTNSTVQCNSLNNNPGCGGNSNKSTTAADYQADIEVFNVAQNSQKAHWLLGAGFDPDSDGTYNFALAAYRGDSLVAQTEIQIIVGEGGSAVPEPGTLLMMGAGFAALAMARRRRV